MLLSWDCSLVWSSDIHAQCWRLAEFISRPDRDGVSVSVRWSCRVTLICLCPSSPLSAVLFLCFSGKWGTLRLHSAAQHADQVRRCVHLRLSPLATAHDLYAFWLLKPASHLIWRGHTSVACGILSPLLTLWPFFASSFWLTMSDSTGPICRIWKMSPTTSTTRTTAVRNSLPSPVMEWTLRRPRGSSLSTPRLLSHYFSGLKYVCNSN